MNAFDLDRQSFGQSLQYHLPPAQGEGWPVISEGLVQLLEQCTAEGLWWATIDLGDDGWTSAFAHLGPADCDSIWAEVLSNFHLPAEDSLSPAQEQALVERGWNRPLDEEGMENFHRFYPADELAAACAEVVATLVGVYEFEDTDEVRVSVDPFVSPP